MNKNKIYEKVMINITKHLQCLSHEGKMEEWYLENTENILEDVLDEDAILRYIDKVFDTILNTQRALERINFLDVHQLHDLALANEKKFKEIMHDYLWDGNMTIGQPLLFIDDYTNPQLKEFQIKKGEK